MIPLRRSPGFVARARIARRWALHVLVLSALIVGLFRAGALYFYCPMMGATHDTPCCEVGDEESDGVAVSETECCQPGAIGHLPASTVAPSLDLPVQTSTLAILDRCPAVVVGSCPRRLVDLPRRRFPPSRTGPPTASARRAQLGVYLL